MTDESGRPGTCRSKVGCEATDEKHRSQRGGASLADLGHRNSLLSPLVVQGPVPCTDFTGTAVVESQPGAYNHCWNVRRPHERMNTSRIQGGFR